MAQDISDQETYNPWTVVNVVFQHLADQGLHPTLGGNAHPGEPAAQLLRALGITPRAEGDLRAARSVQEHLAQLRASVFGGEEDVRGERALSQIETRDTPGTGL
jgi:hypothetical protein